jgi:hypothetical protein
MADDNLPDGQAPDEVEGGPNSTPTNTTSNEEQLDVGASSGGTSQSFSQKQAESDDDRNQMSSTVKDLTNISAAGDNNQEFLDKLLNTPADQLIPWEDCYLPSKGLYYDGDWSNASVKVRAMGQTAEKILATQRLAKSGQSIDYLFRECCQFPDGFDPINLLLGDRVFLLYFIRGITHGNMYEFAFTCPKEECGAVSTHTYDLNELASTIKWADDSQGEEPFKLTLPYLSEATKRDVWVTLRYLRAYDANDILSRKKVKDKITVRPGKTVRTRNKPAPTRRQQMQQLDDSITENLEKVIVSVMGTDDRFKIRSFVNQLHAQDTATIREWLKNNTPGIDNSVIVGCPQCDTDHTVELPITEAFFRPAKRS